MSDCAGFLALKTILLLASLGQGRDFLEEWATRARFLRRPPDKGGFFRTVPHATAQDTLFSAHPATGGALPAERGRHRGDTASHARKSKTWSWENVPPCKPANSLPQVEESHFSDERESHGACDTV